MRSIRILITAILSLTLISLSMTAQTTEAAPAAAPTRDADAEHLRQLFYRGDAWSVGIPDGEKLAEKSGASLETRAWFLSPALRDIDLGQFMPLYTMLSAMTKEAPDSPWTLLSRAAASDVAVDAGVLCDSAIAKASSNSDVLILCTDIMAETSASDSARSASAFVEKHRSELESSADGLVAEGEALSRIGWNTSKSDPVAIAALYDRALKLDPHNLRAVSHKADDLIRTKKYKEAETLVADALTWGGASVDLHQTQWHLLANLGLSKDEEGRRIADDMMALLPKALPGPYTFGLRHLREIAPSRADAVAELVLKLYPDSLTADMVRVEMAAAKLELYPNVADAPSALRDEVAGKLIDFMNRPQRKCVYAENGATSTLWELLIKNGDANVSTELLWAAAKALRPNGAAQFALAVADRKENLEQIEQLAQSHLDGVLEKARERSTQWRLPRYEAYESRDLWLESAAWQDVLGWAYLQQDRVKDAAPRLLEAENLLSGEANPDHAPGKTVLDFRPLPLMHLGRLYTAQGNYSKAEAYLKRSLAIEVGGEREHPAIAAFKDLYRSQHGGSDGLDSYMAAVYEQDRTNRKTALLRERLREMKAIEPFKLVTVDGKTISSDSLKGKYVVINFWGTWCGPCKYELPELQKFYEKYKDNPNVVYLTIDDGDTPEKVEKFQAEKHYTFPVLMEGDYLTKVTIKSFPTTWFIDRDGNKIFEKMGSSKRVLEEFSWRVEAMQEADTRAAANKTTASEAQTAKKASGGGEEVKR